MPRNKYPEETVQKILDVSLKLFLEKGYEQTTILDIVNNLGGLTRGAFYHHFKSKEEVLNALGDKLFRDSNPFEKVKDEKGLNGLQKIKKAVKMQHQNLELSSINITSMSLMKNPRFLVEQIQNNQKLSTNVLKPLIEEGIRDGSIKSYNAHLLSEFTILLTDFWLIPSIYPCTKQELLEKIVFVKGLFDLMGFPFFDEEMIELFTNMLDKIELE
ncbi:MAG: TetR/AcrR family transcriptional regulator [Lachnospiraceae bacterium]